MDEALTEISRRERPGQLISSVGKCTDSMTVPWDFHDNPEYFPALACREQGYHCQFHGWRCTSGIPAAAQRLPKDPSGKPRAATIDKRTTRHDTGHHVSDGGT
jgi:hypothetical protein